MINKIKLLSHRFCLNKSCPVAQKMGKTTITKQIESGKFRMEILVEECNEPTDSSRDTMWSIYNMDSGALVETFQGGWFNDAYCEDVDYCGTKSVEFSKDEPNTIIVATWMSNVKKIINLFTLPQKKSK